MQRKRKLCICTAWGKSVLSSSESDSSSSLQEIGKETGKGTALIFLFLGSLVYLKNRKEAKSGQVDLNIELFDICQEKQNWFGSKEMFVLVLKIPVHFTK